MTEAIYIDDLLASINNMADLKERNARLEAALAGLMRLFHATYGDEANRCAQYRVAKGVLSFCNHDAEAEDKKECRKPVDLSVLIDSGIDVGYCGEERGEWLTPTSDDWTALALAKYRYKPRMNYWFSCLNFDSPSQLIDDLDRAGFDVQGDFKDNFIITGLQDGYCWPWEVEV